jgi:diacylglycerol kinase (ATP)
MTSPPRRVALVFNPATRKKKVPERREQTAAALARAGLEVMWLETTPTDAGEGLVRRALDADVDLVLVSGGDGTVMACATALADTGVPLALLPAGTGNLLAVNFNVPRDLEGAVEVALSGERRRIDLGCCEQGCFAVMAGMGFDAAMLRDTSPALKARLGALSYVVGGLRHLRSPAVGIEVRLDNSEPISIEAHMVLVGNLGMLQGGFRALPDADPQDGLLNVAIVTAGSIGAWLKVALRVVRGRVGNDRRVQTHVASSVEVRAARPMPMELDGDIFDDARVLTVETRPGALTLCVPGNDVGLEPIDSSNTSALEPDTIQGGST